MTAANLTLTHSKAQTVTSVSPLDRESSSKNDISKTLAYHIHLLTF
jgi:hypothetical protein